MKKTTLKTIRGCALLIAASCMLTVLQPVSPVWADHSETILKILEGRDDKGIYSDHARQHSGAPEPSVRKLYDTDDSSYRSDDGSASWDVTVDESGNYNFAVVYSVDEGTESDIRAAVLIDGEIPFAEAGRIRFPQSWRDELPLVSDHRGNDIRPYTEPLIWDREMLIADDTGRFGAFRFYLEKGVHKIEINSQDSSLDVKAIILTNNSYHLSYEDHRRENSSKATSQTSGFSETVQAEDAYAKTGSSIQSGTDRSGPATVPSDPVALKLNILYGNSWKNQGETVYWKLDIPEDGWYTIRLRFRQNYLPGLFTNRRFTLDGKVPFAEAEFIRFNHDDDWQYMDLGAGTTVPGNAAGDDAFRFFIEKGEHLIGLESVSGEMADFIRSMEDIIYVLNHLYRKIIVIAGTNPDPYRDYFLDSEIPELLPVFEEISATLTAMADDLEEMTGKKGGNASILRETGKQLDDFVKDAQTIPKRLKNFQANISAISALMLLLQQQPLDLDHITVTSEGTLPRDEEPGFWERIRFQFRAFIGSFFMDYTIIGSTSGGSENKTPLKVWYGGSREQAEIVQRMIDDSFTRNFGIGVELELVQVPVAQAVFAGTAPDIVMNVSRGQPVNLAARGALAELSSMNGFDAIKGSYAKDAFIPYSYSGKVYGIPIQMDFHLLFVRDDIFEELGIEVPDTWDDFYKILPVLQGNHMSVGLPYTSMSSQATIDAGMGAKDIFPALLLQRGGKVYNNDLSASALDSDITMEAFKTWTELYSQFELPLVYDFYNRFRSGEIPMGVQPYVMFNMLEAAAPEIRGLWSMHLIPGTLKEDGTTDHSAAASGSAGIMIEHGTGTRREEGWEFLKWWSSSDAQIRYGRDIETLMGKASRYNPANLEALVRLPWTNEQEKILLEQIGWLTEIPEIPGGYYTSRSIDNAFRNVVFSKRNYRDALLEQHVIINSEIARKRKEFKLDGE